MQDLLKVLHVELNLRVFFTSAALFLVRFKNHYDCIELYI